MGNRPGHKRADHIGQHRVQFERNKKIIFATQEYCAICGRRVDFSIKYPDPMCPTVDHIIPLDKGGHPSDIANLQLAHMSCNRQKGSKLRKAVVPVKQEQRGLLLSADWKTF